MIGLTGIASWQLPASTIKERASHIKGGIEQAQFSSIMDDNECWSAQAFDEEIDGNIAINGNVKVVVVGDLYEDEYLNNTHINKADYILNRYQEYGVYNCAQLNGSYLFLIGDLDKRELYIGTDENSIIPLYYAIIQNTICFSWDVSAVIDYMPETPVLDYQTMFNWLLMGGRGFGDETRFESIKRLEPGSVVTLNNAGSNVFRATPFSFASDGSSSEEQLLHDAVDSIKLAVDRRISPCDNILLGLSGGLDSRIVLAAAEKFADRITCYTFGKADFAEKDIATDVANYYNLPHIKINYEDNIYIPYAKDGVFYSAGASLFKHGIQTHLYAALKTRYKSQGLMMGSALDLLVGSTFCPDEIFELGNREQLNKYYTDNLFNIPRDKFIKLFQSSLVAENFYEGAQETLRANLERVPGDEPADVNDAFAFDVRIKRWYNHNLIYPLYSYRILSPTYDKDFMSVMARVPSELRKDSLFRIKLLSNLHPELAAIQYDSTMQPASLLPPYTKEFERIQHLIDELKEKIWIETDGKTYLPSRKYDANFMEWFRVRQDYQDFLKDTLVGSNSFLCDQFLNRKAVQELIDEHLKGRFSHHKVLVMLLSMELTARVYIKKESGVNYNFVDFSEHLGGTCVD